MTGPQVLAVPALDPADEITAGVWGAIAPEFRELLRWSGERRVLVFPQGHPLLGWAVCSVSNCDRRSTLSSGLCPACIVRWTDAGRPAVEEFIAIERVRFRDISTGPCAVDQCERPWKTSNSTLCDAHHSQRRKNVRLPLAQFVAHPDVVGHTSFGPCKVVACTRDRDGHGPYCRSHSQTWRALRRRTDAHDHDERRWRLTQPAVSVGGGEVSLRGLPERVVAEMLFGLQERIAQGIKTPPHQFRPLVDHLRANELDSIEDVTPDHVATGTRWMLNSFVTATRRLRMDPETERFKDEWDTAVFGCAGILRFGEISQSWLRDAAKIWAYDDLPRRRGDARKMTCQQKINGVEALSESLRLQRADDGTDPTALGRSDITGFLNRMAFLQAEGAISADKRIRVIRGLRQTLGRMRALGLTRPGQPLHRLPDDFTFTDSEVPDEPEGNEAGRDLPVEVMRQLCGHLDHLEAASGREIRVAVELIIDTGRRPDEICQLKLDCLVRDGQGQSILLYDNLKANRKDRRLPIGAATVAVIEAQQQRTRDRFPNEPADQLKLLPAPSKNPHGRKAIIESWLSGRHREWVQSLPATRVPTTAEVDGKPVTRTLPFDKNRITPYAYRHSYAQRHADAGVPVDVLRELLDHRQMETTQGYYRVGEQRRREAVERVTTMQFDRHGIRVWRDAKVLLDSEHLRRAVGEVAVPYGSCSEPSNVAAGGDDCPVRFRCVGCAHFSTDVSYLPDLEAYLADLLRNREGLLATIDADDWAKGEAMPSDEEITRIRRLITRVKTDLDDLSTEEQAQIEESVAIVRKARNQVVGLGTPRVRQPLPDVRPERTA
jgi:integrase